MNDREQVSFPPITGTAKWLTVDAARLLREGQTAILRVWTPIKSRRKQMRQQDYNISAIIQGGVIVAVRMTYGGKSYLLTLGSGEGVDRVITCNCFDANYRPREGGGPGSGCRHANSCRAALSEIGLL